MRSPPVEPRRAAGVLAILRSPSLEVRRATALLASALLALTSCERRDARDPTDGEEPSGADSGRALQLADPQLYATCDTLEQSVTAVVTRGAQRTNGRFTGTARGLTRYGCRITAADVLPPEAPQRPLEAVWQGLAARGWTVEQAYVADGPEGSMLGLRSSSLLCVLTHSWQTGSDDERAARPDVAVPYNIEVECFREAARQPPSTTG
jgi:hypothetical protein